VTNDHYWKNTDAADAVQKIQSLFYEQSVLIPFSALFCYDDLNVASTHRDLSCIFNVGCTDQTGPPYPTIIRLFHASLRTRKVEVA
jgi:hypothetical protein